jgi:hypothetical protein
MRSVEGISAVHAEEEVKVIRPRVHGGEEVKVADRFMNRSLQWPIRVVFSDYRVSCVAFGHGGTEDQAAAKSR